MATIQVGDDRGLVHNVNIRGERSSNSGSILNVEPVRFSGYGE